MPAAESGVGEPLAEEACSDSATIDAVRSLGDAAPGHASDTADGVAMELCAPPAELCVGVRAQAFSKA